VLLKLQTINYIKIRSVDTVLPKSRVENDKDKQLHDMVQKYSSGEIYHELLCLNTKQEQNYETITSYLQVYICFKLLE
jgi:hypothetical protein